MPPAAGSGTGALATASRAVPLSAPGADNGAAGIIGVRGRQADSDMSENTLARASEVLLNKVRSNDCERRQSSGFAVCYHVLRRLVARTRDIGVVNLEGGRDARGSLSNRNNLLTLTNCVRISSIVSV
jgi:hypothetical protein